MSDKLVTIETMPCPDCGKEGKVENVSENGYKRWRAGDFIQNALPELSPEKREQMMTGMHPECWNRMFPPDPDECNGICMTGYDVGIPDPGIAYPHPDCPVHGDPKEH